MNAQRFVKRTLGWGGALALVLLVTPSARAQDATVYGVAGYDGDDTNIQLVGGTVRPSGTGLRPVVGLQAYRLGYTSGTETTNVLAVTPSVGAEYRASGGSLGARVGYTFQNRDQEGGDVDAPFIGGEGGSSGLVSSVQANSWATPVELQGIASYNFGSDYVWTQGQAIVPVVRLSSGYIGAGVEAVFQGQTNNDTAGSENYRAYEVGPVLRFNNGRSFLVTLSGGLKSTNVADRDNTYFSRLSVVRYGITF